MIKTFVSIKIYMFRPWLKYTIGARQYSAFQAFQRLSKIIKDYKIIRFL